MVYKEFTKVVILQKIVRQNGASNDAFRELLLRLRNGETTREDWDLLLTRTPTNAINKSDFSEATHLYYDKMSVTSFNIEKLKSLGKPIARVNALHSNQAAAIATPEDAGGLDPVLFIAEEANGKKLDCAMEHQVQLCIFYTKMAIHHPAYLLLLLFTFLSTLDLLGTTHQKLFLYTQSHSNGIAITNTYQDSNFLFA